MIYKTISTSTYMTSEWLWLEQQRVGDEDAGPVESSGRPGCVLGRDRVGLRVCLPVAWCPVT